MFRVLSQLSNSTVNGVRESAVIAIEAKRRRTSSLSTLNVSVKERVQRRNMKDTSGSTLRVGGANAWRETWKDVIKETKGWRCG